MGAETLPPAEGWPPMVHPEFWNAANLPGTDATMLSLHSKPWGLEIRISPDAVSVTVAHLDGTVGTIHIPDGAVRMLQHLLNDHGPTSEVQRAARVQAEMIRRTGERF